MKVIIDQPFGIGDILFLSPLIKQLDVEEAVWPVVDHYYWINDYLSINNLSFIKQSEFQKERYQDFITVPFQHAHSIVGNRAQDCMEAKYLLLDADLELWKTLSFIRNFNKEQKLIELLDLDIKSSYVFINNHFASKEFNYKTSIALDSDLKVVYMEYVSGFTLLDWCGVIEHASEIHTVSTALFFVLKAIKPKVPMHLYPRKPLDKDLTPIKTLIDKSWICHE